jgi:Flp pilus assembly protein CpaB
MTQRNLILMIVAVSCGLGAAFLTMRINAKPKTDDIEVFVAAKNLPVGTVLSKEAVHNNKLVIKKSVPKNSVSPSVVLNEQDLLDRRLTRSIETGEYITSNALTKGSIITLPEGMDMITLPVTTTAAAAGFVGPGTRVDVLATYRQGNRLEAFPLLVNMLVLAVDKHASYETTDANKGGAAFTNVSSVSFAVTQEQALILKMAEHAGCHLSLLLRNPAKKNDDHYDPEQVKKQLRALITPTRQEDPSDDTSNGSATTASKLETTKVWVAREDIPVGTPLTEDLIQQKFLEKEIPKENAEGAITNPKEKLGLAFRTILAKNQWLVENVLGQPPAKSSPREEFQAPKLDTADSQPTPTQPQSPSVPKLATRDVVVHTAHSTEIYRYVEIRPGEWRFKEKLTPEQISSPEKPTQNTPAPANPATAPAADRPSSG